jgi:hypothetical protein
MSLFRSFKASTKDAGRQIVYEGHQTDMGAGGRCASRIEAREKKDETYQRSRSTENPLLNALRDLVCVCTAA